MGSDLTCFLLRTLSNSGHRRGVRPQRWTVSGGGFDRLPGVMILELCRAQVAERGVESSGVVDLIDKAWKVSGDVFESFVIHQIDGLDLEGLHKALGLGIVIGIATSAHRADETMFGQQVAIRLGGVLRPTIGVVDAALRRLSYSDSRLQCRNSNAGIDRATNRVADYAA